LQNITIFTLIFYGGNELLNTFLKHSKFKNLIVEFFLKIQSLLNFNNPLWYENVVQCSWFLKQSCTIKYRKLNHHEKKLLEHGLILFQMPLKGCVFFLKTLKNLPHTSPLRDSLIEKPPF
jgi:hypothetical protein